MPELPEVETVVRTIRPHVWGCDIMRFMVSPTSKPPNVSASQVEGQHIAYVSRYGKYILFKLNEGYLVSHLRMTGQWHFFDRDRNLPTTDKHFRWGFSICDHTGEFSGFLWFKDARKFGTLDWTPTLTEYKPLAKMGVDGLTLDEPKVVLNIAALAGKSRRPIKNFLLDQKIIAGAGNIYASEVLYAAGVSPLTPSREVSPSKIKEVCSKLCSIFHDSIAMGGSSISDYTGGHYHEVLKVYGREGELCFACGTKIVRVVQAGRSTFYCPKCQGVENEEVL